MPKFRMRLRTPGGTRIPEGYEITVTSRTTASEPDANDVEEVLYTLGWRNYDLSVRSAGNWDCVEIDKESYPYWTDQHNAYIQAKEAEEKAKHTEKIQKTESRKSAEVEEDDDDGENQSIGILGKILLMPFKIIWWIIKQLLKFIGLSFLLTIFSSNNNDD